MSAYHATVQWTATGEPGSALYGRDHHLIFDGLTIKGSASQGNVPPGTASADAVDPEELFVAAVAQCHMLWFLDLAQRAGVRIDSYEDKAEGILGKDSRGLMVMTTIVLRPRTVGSATLSQLDDLHQKAHAVCFIANSIRAKVMIDFRT